MTDVDRVTSPVDTDTFDGGYSAAVLCESSADAVFEALTTPSSLTAWWMSASGSGLEGGSLTFRFGEAVAVVMRVDAAQRSSVVEWAVLASEPLQDWVGTTIRFDLSTTESGGCRVQFKHTGLTPQLDCFDMCKAGWEQYLPSLISYVDRGQGNPLLSARAA